jgi:pimeloyl-ACP methyl ester carboxylesterase
LQAKKEEILSRTIFVKQSIRISFFVLSAALLILVATRLIIQAQDMITFPSFTGDHDVGRIELLFTDQSRQEIFTDAPDDVRELMTTIYYPAEDTGTTQPAPYGDDGLKDEASQWPGINPESWSQIQTGIASEAPVTTDEERYPVIVFSPGLATLPVYYTSLLAEIASHGYIVVSISRTYTTVLTVFPDGRSIRSNDAGTDVDGREGDTYFDVQERRAGIGAVWAGDIRFMLDQLEIMNQEDDLLGGHLDLTRIGLIGHSFGGSSGAEAAYLDNRIGAVVSMDSYLDGDVALEGLSQPYLLMEPANPDYEDPSRTPSEEQLTAMGLTVDDLDMLLLRVSHNKLLETSSAGYRLRLEGAQHLTFTTDLHIFAPHFPARINQGMVGTLDGERALQIISQYTVAFFDQHLKGQDSALLDGTMDTDPEVIFESF